MKPFEIYARIQVIAARIDAVQRRIDHFNWILEDLRCEQLGYIAQYEAAARADDAEVLAQAVAIVEARQ